MFSSLKLRALLGIYIFLLVSIPVGAYLASQQQTVKSRASEEKPKVTLKPTPKAATPSAKLKPLEIAEDEPSPTSDSPTIATSFGPTLSLKVTLEGRPDNNQTSKLFVGITEGSLAKNPKFLLSFNIDLPANGEYSDLSIAGLSAGVSYTALLKGPTQLASSSTFTMSPTVTNLNRGETINLLSGDLNEDNTINSNDYSIVQKAVGATSSSKSWNGNADFNKDGVINTFDLSIVSKNLGKAGASGVWTSPVATASGSLSPQGSNGGYWLWVPGNVSPK